MGKLVSRQEFRTLHKGDSYIIVQGWLVLVKFSEPEETKEFACKSNEAALMLAQLMIDFADTAVDEHTEAHKYDNDSPDW